MAVEMAVELGDKLAAYSRSKFFDYQNIKIINTDFTAFTYG